ncbi:MAG: META domain-containing protein [Candidatus Nanopelagicales bacterium]
MSGPRTTRPVRTALGLLAAVALTGCAGDSAGGDSAAAPPELAGTSWNLATFTHDPGGEMPAVADAVAPLAFAAGGTVAGSTGCNRFTGTFTQEGSDVRIMLGPMTLMACVGPVAEQEAAVIPVLSEVAIAAIDGSDLRLSDTEGNLLLVYTPGTATLVGSAWQATGINNGTGGVVSADETSAATAQFGPDGTVSGSGGCNTFTAPYTLDGSQGVEIGPVASTKMACPEPVSSTEQQFFAGLEAATTYRLEGDTLTLRDAQDATQVTLRAVN